MSEKTKLIFHRVLWLVLVVLGVFLPAIIEAFKPKLEIIDSECYIKNYYEYSDQTYCNVELKFNRPVSIFGDNMVMVSFYDVTGKLLDIQEDTFYIDYSDYKSASNVSFWVDGKVDTFKVISHSFIPKTCIWPYFTLCISIPLFIHALLLCYKEREFEGKKISVYAGFYHRTLRINDEICDEHNTLVTWSAIKLSTTIKNDDDKEDKIEVTISLLNRIAIKINDKLISDKKQNNKN